jgi:transcription initiation factor TFIIIB Brf1 subunit/transcription initiation factor TFIIB
MFPDVCEYCQNDNLVHNIFEDFLICNLCGVVQNYQFQRLSYND